MIDPIGLNALIPDWKEKGAPLDTPVLDDRFYYLSAGGGSRVPNLLFPPLMSNHGNYIASLGLVARWLGREAEALGVEIYPGFAAVDVEKDEKGAVTGIVTGDMGVARDGHHKTNFTPGMALRGKYTLIAEGARGSLTKKLLGQYRLAEGRAPQTYGLGLKELWELPKDNHQRGLVMHTMGSAARQPNWAAVRSSIISARTLRRSDSVVHLDYKNPYLSPFEEFQRFKNAPDDSADAGSYGRRVAYGARAITEGGLQAVPQLVFPGGALIGCAGRASSTCRESRAAITRF